MKFMHLSVLLLILLSVAEASAQTTPKITFPHPQRVLISFDADPAPPPEVKQKLGEIANYGLYEATNLAKVPSEVISINALTDPAEKARRLAALGESLQRENLVNISVPPRCDADCQRITIELKRPYEYDKNYVLSIAGVNIAESPPAVAADPTRIEKTLKQVAEIQQSLDSAKFGREVRVKADFPIRANSSLQLDSQHLKLAPDKSQTKVVYDQHQIAVASALTTANELTLELEQRLPIGQNLVIRQGLTDLSLRPVTAAGRVEVPGLPAPPDAPRLDAKLLIDAGVHQKPVFDLDLSYARAFPLSRTSLWSFEPSTTIDVGLGQTKSANSIILNLPLTRYVNVCRDESLDESTGEWRVVNRCKGATAPTNLKLKKGETAVPGYYEWAHAPALQLSSVKFGIGPKFEADRNLGRVNALGNARLDFLFGRWLWTIQEQRKLLSLNLEKADLAIIELDRGFKIVPYISLDFGGHVTTEKIEKKVNNIPQTLFVPQHKILRGNLGMSSLFQWKMLGQPMTLSIDEYLFYMAVREQVGYTTDSGVALRQLRGFHHRGKAAWDIYFDPARHYSFNLTYENGRLAPNFEYLNKFSAGVRVLY